MWHDGSSVPKEKSKNGSTVPIWVLSSLSCHRAFPVKLSITLWREASVKSNIKIVSLPKQRWLTSSVYVVYHDDREAIFTFCIHSCFWFITACSIHSSLIQTHNNIVWSSLTTTVNCSPLMCFLLLIPTSNRMVYNAESFNENPNHKGKHIHLGCTDTERTRRRYHFR